MSDGFSRRSRTSASGLADSKRNRIIGIAIFVVALMVLYTFQLFSLQILEGSAYHKRATLVSQRTDTLLASRGEIYDRNHDAALATNREAFDLSFVPASAPRERIPQMLAKLSQRLRLPYDYLEKKVPPTVYGQFAPIDLMEGVDYDVIKGLAEQSEDFPGVRWDQKPVRLYHSLGSLSSVVGYVGDITEEELQVLYNSGYDRRSIVGKAGLEKQYDFLLRGRDGVRYMTVDASGRNLSGGTPREQPPQSGKSILLTIDRGIQTLAERALGDRIGSVVILKPSTGEVLAMVSYPTFDPNAFTTADGPKIFQSLLTDTRYPFLDRAIQATYPPASTFKIIMSAALLGDAVIDPRKQIFCGPEYKLGDRTFKEHDPRGFGWTDMPKGLAQSANVYFYTVGVEYLGIDRISRYAREFGLGSPSGIDLPGELSGQVPDPTWKEKSLHSPWLGGDTANTSIGQGYLQVTPLQMADAMAMVANGGKVYRPHLLKEVRDPVTDTVEETATPEVIYDSNAADKIFHPLQEALRGVITGGTPEVVLTTRAVQIAGKTGTGEDGEKGSANHSWFVAYAPYDEPDLDKRIVVVVQVERTNSWEWWAPKAANIIFQGLFAHETYEQALKSLGLPDESHVAPAPSR